MSRIKVVLPVVLAVFAVAAVVLEVRSGVVDADAEGLTGATQEAQATQSTQPTPYSADHTRIDEGPGPAKEPPSSF